MRMGSVGALARVLDDAFDPMLGIVRAISEVWRNPAAPDIFHYETEAADTAAFGTAPNFGHTGAASAFKERAIAKAVGEAIERYCAAIYDVDHLPLTSADSGDIPCIDPDLFAMYLPEQYASPGFPFVPFRRDTVLRWTQTANLVTGRVAFAPATLVWIPYQCSTSHGEPAIAQGISTGLACHETPARATLSGLCEVIERDAFTIFWQAQISPPRIKIDTAPEIIRAFAARFEATGDSLFLFDLTTDVGIATVLSVLRGRAPNRPHLVFAAAADVDPEMAAIKALEELDATRRYSDYALSTVPVPAPDNDFVAVYQQVHHLRLASDRANAEHFTFVFESTRAIAFDELPSLTRSSHEEELNAVIRSIMALGLTPYVADLTSRDVRELGLSVVRALVPGMHPLAVGHHIRARANRRLYEVPQKLGHVGLAFGAQDNLFPHPYP